MKNKIIFLIFFLAVTNSLFAYPPTEEGKSIFMSRCAACHNVNKNMTGPALSGVDLRRSIDWIISFVQSSQSMVKKGDTTAIALFEKFKRIQMPDHADLTNQNIKNIVAYIKAESKLIPDDKAPFVRPGQKKPTYLPISIRNYGFFIVYFAVVIALILTLYFAVQLKTFERNKSRSNDSD